MGGFAVRRNGGGSADLMAAETLLRAGHAVIVFPEGSRSRDGEIAEFRAGAFRLAAAAGVPVVPVGIAGTRDLLPVHGRLRRRPVAVRIGAPITADAEAGSIASASRTAVEALAAAPAPRPMDRFYRRLRLVGLGGFGLAMAFGVGFAEAVVWPLIPELTLAMVAVAAPRAGLRLACAAAAGSLAGGLVAYGLGAAAVQPPAPLTTPRMHAVAAAQLADEGAGALRHQPFGGIPYKVYAVGAGERRVPLGAFAGWTALVRGGRIIAVGAALAAIGALGRRFFQRFFTVYAAWLASVFAVSLHSVVRAWS